jgi:hypothetical protein
MKRLPRTFGCAVELSLELLGGKWKPIILARLKDGPLRYGELRRLIPSLSDKMLTERLADLQAIGLIAAVPLLLTGRGITVGAISVESRADFEAMNRAIALHRLRPVIDRTFPFAKAKAAYRHFEGRGHFGKVVITHG